MSEKNLFSEYYSGKDFPNFANLVCGVCLLLFGLLLLLASGQHKHCLTYLPTQNMDQAWTMNSPKRRKITFSRQCNAVYCEQLYIRKK